MVARKQSQAIAKKNKALLDRIKTIKSEHPAWGHRRVWAYLRYREGLLVNKKRIYRLLSENNLLATQTRNNRAKRTPTRSKPRANKPNEIWGIDMTTVMVDSWGWVYLHVVLDWSSKKTVYWLDLVE